MGKSKKYQKKSEQSAKLAAVSARNNSLLQLEPAVDMKVRVHVYCILLHSVDGVNKDLLTSLFRYRAIIPLQPRQLLFLLNRFVHFLELQSTWYVYYANTYN